MKSSSKKAQFPPKRPRLTSSKKPAKMPAAEGNQE
jgi:hypothetical protein